MDERLFAQLAAHLRAQAVVLASVLDTRGATPRKRGSRMLITRDATEFSIGGGVAESRVIDAARGLLRDEANAGELKVDLSGRAGAAGVCGGTMRLSLRRWAGAADAARAEAIAGALAAGTRVVLDANDLGASAGTDEVLEPDPRLLIVGAGHCGQALCELARHLAFDVWVFDERENALDGADYPGATRRSGDYASLAEACSTERGVFAVLLNRDFPSDVATLHQLAGRPLAFLGMMGSRKRIGEVLAALAPEVRAAIEPRLQAPVGLDIGAHTPHEIAISILAQLVQARRRAENPPR